MQALNLPQYAPKIKQQDGKVEIFDVIRKKYVHLLPEEWVRQHMVNFLIHHLGYPKGLIRIESGLHYNRLLKRSDILVYDNAGKPHLLVECKSYSQTLSQAALDQVTTYNKTHEAPYIVLTNGLNHYCCKLEDGRYTFESAIPGYQ